MVAAPKRIIWTFVGMQSRRTFPIISYASDVDAALLTWDDGSGAPGASSPTSYIPSEDVTLTDVCVESGLTDTSFYRLISANTPTDIVIGKAQYDDGNPMRPRLNRHFKAGSVIRCIQIA